ncbi:hypothetical protein ALNOE001_20070 [Candidatus Methanobinarius endosymbioticus]|uniref:DUF11 domain-containing protein n=1 Tax=Candidatus Methanobinarius endosymbioticus TaxID=2006182 RepID=A0A366M8B5_9EURY|nr:hypothetical protein ALNOE001_20070 [Candidatus Methanobinarius endosymbioticus]
MVELIFKIGNQVNETIIGDIRTILYSENVTLEANKKYSLNTLSNDEDIILEILSIATSNIKIVKTANVTSVLNGDLVEFTIGVTNNGPSSTFVNSTDFLPDGMIYVSDNSSYGSGTKVGNELVLILVLIIRIIILLMKLLRLILQAL